MHKTDTRIAFAQRLLRANGELLGGMSDDVDRAYFDDGAEKRWDAARAHAAQVLRDGIW